MAHAMATICAVGLVLLAVSPAEAAAPEPDFVLKGPTAAISEFEAPCGVGVDSFARVYLADHYRHMVHVFTAAPTFITQLRDVDPPGGPCGLAISANGHLYVNNYHRNVELFIPSTFPLTTTTTYMAAGIIDTSHPTGVAVDPTMGSVYVATRTHIAVYDVAGAPLTQQGEPLRIGEGNLANAYGIAHSRHPATLGRLYVPDHGTDTVKVFDPALDLDEPVAEIAGPPGGFGSLRDSAIAVDRVTGEIYVADTLANPQKSERPQAVIHVFNPDGTHKGQLKYAIFDPSPPGLAVDNSNFSLRQGRVYVTSGPAAGGCLIAYPPGAATNHVAAPHPQCAPAAPTQPASGGGGGGGTSLGTQGARGTVTSHAQASPKGPLPSAGRSAVIEQKGNLRVAVSGAISPQRLPRRGRAPISVAIGGQISTTDGSDPPQLRSLRIELNRQGHIERTGLPQCPYKSLQPASTQRALGACRAALVGRGSFDAQIGLGGGEERFDSKGKLLLFNGTQRRRPVIFGHIYVRHPFATSFVIVFEIRGRGGKGTYGTVLEADLPKALGRWGNLTGLQMTLERRYRARGKRKSFASAGCPAPKGFPGALFPMARSTFAFEGGKRIVSILTSECKTRG